MVQGINSDFVSAYGVSGSTGPDVKCEKVAQSGRNVKNDRVEISEQARAAMQSFAVVSAGGKAPADHSLKQPGKRSGNSSFTKDAKTALAARAAFFKNTGLVKDNLSDYSVKQLEQMVWDGKLSKLEERIELARRQEQNHSKPDDSVLEKPESSGRAQDDAAIGSFFDMVA